MREKRLTQREAEVLKLIIKGKSNTEIAQELVISIHTARAHSCNIMAKLDVNNRIKAAVYASNHPEIFENLAPERIKKAPVEKPAGIIQKPDTERPQFRIRWTEGSIDCYNLKSDCSRCNLSESIKPNCKMANTIKILEAKLGPPPVIEEIPEVEEQKTGLCFQSCINMVFREKGYGCKKGVQRNPNKLIPCQYYKKEEEEMPKNLTQKEKDVLKLFCAGIAEHEISIELNIPYGSVNAYISTAVGKYKDVIEYKDKIPKKQQLAEYLRKINYFKDDTKSYPKINFTKEMTEEQVTQNVTLIVNENIDNKKESDNIHTVDVIENVIEDVVKHDTTETEISDSLKEEPETPKCESIEKDRSTYESNLNLESSFNKVAEKYSKEIDTIKLEVGGLVLSGDIENYRLSAYQEDVYRLNQKLSLLIEVREEIKKLTA